MSNPSDELKVEHVSETTSVGTTQSSERRVAQLSARDNSVIFILLISAFVVILNETFMSVALPRLMSDLNISATTGQWLTTAFLLTMAVVIPITGMLMTRIPTRPLYLLAMGLFIAGTALGALAPSFAWLVAARVVQACGTAIMMPLLMTTVMTVVPPMMRGRMMGRITIVISVAPALGPTISGLILNFLSWHWLFILMLPVAGIATLFGMLRVQNISETKYVKIDGVSVILSVLGFGGLVYGVNSIGEAVAGEALLSPAIPLAIGAVALGIFIWRQKALEKTDNALLDLRTFKTPSFTVSVLLIMMSMIALFGALLMIPIYAVQVLGLDTLAIGLILLPGGLLMGLLGPPVGRLFDRIGARPLLVTGTALTSVTLWVMSTFSADTQVWMIVLLYLVLSIGLACLFTPLFAVGLGSLPKHLYAYGSATFATAQQLAGAVGTTLFSLVFALVAATAVSSGVPELDGIADGAGAAFRIGAILATVAFGISWFIKPGAMSEESDEDSLVSH